MSAWQGRLAGWRLGLQAALWRLGPAWALAAACLLAAGLVAWLAWWPAQRDLDQALAQAASRQQALARAAPPVAPAPPADGAAALGALLRRAPPPGEQLRRIAALADEQQVRLARADYQVRPLPGAPLRQWQVTQPVRAPYPRLRAYLESVLRELPNASLDQLSARREGVGQGEVEARLRWTLWVAGPEAPPAPATGPAGAQARPSPRAMEPLLALVPREALLPERPAPRRAAPPPADLFAARSWAPPPPPVVALPAPPPVAPPLPFTYLGKKLEAGRWEVYVARDDRSLVLREGEVVEAAWRVGRIGPTTLSLTYLPLGQAQTLAIGDDR